MPIILTNISSWFLSLVTQRILINSEELCTFASPLNRPQGRACFLVDSLKPFAGMDQRRHRFLPQTLHRYPPGLCFRLAVILVHHLPRHPIPPMGQLPQFHGAPWGPLHHDSSANGKASLFQALLIALHKAPFPHPPFLDHAPHNKFPFVSVSLRMKCPKRTLQTSSSCGL